MPEVFKNSFKLRNTYKTNGIIYSLKSIPLIRKLLPSALYSSRGLKSFANVISILMEFFSIFVGKALYLFLIYLAVLNFKGKQADSLVHIMFFLTVIGGFINTQIFNPTKDKFYAIFIMRMDARNYALSNYYYFLLKTLAGFIPFSILFGRLCGASLLTCFAIAFFVLTMKLCFTGFSLWGNKENGKKLNENKISVWVWIGIAVLLAAAFLPPYLGYCINELVFRFIVAASIIPAFIAFRYIIDFDRYRAMYKELLTPESFDISEAKKNAMTEQQKQMQKKITVEPLQNSNKSGYKYFNELFMKRHAKLLTKSAKKITIVSAAIFVIAVAACLISSKLKQNINEFMLTFLPYFLFVMYIINRGKVITQAMFMNCDHSMLAYRFYRQPKAVLLLFIERLKYIIVINLMPATVIAVGLPLLLLITGGTEQPVNYILLFVSIIAMSVFFSVHNMVLYYLLQPYNINLEMKNATYGIVSSITYFICYAAIGKKIPTLIFGTGISAFCIIYIAVALVLTYKLAPKTFRLR